MLFRSVAIIQREHSQNLLNLDGVVFKVDKFEEAQAGVGWCAFQLSSHCIERALRWMLPVVIEIGCHVQFRVHHHICRDDETILRVGIPPLFEIPDGQRPFLQMPFTPRAMTNAQCPTKLAIEPSICIFHVVTTTGPRRHVNFDPI